jgi:hypothetical protein
VKVISDHTNEKHIVYPKHRLVVVWQHNTTNRQDTMSGTIHGNTGAPPNHGGNNRRYPPPPGPGRGGAPPPPYGYGRPSAPHHHQSYQQPSHQQQQQQNFPPARPDRALGPLNEGFKFFLAHLPVEATVTDIRQYFEVRVWWY